jgi:plastocyanin
VSISGNRFSPATVTIAVGGTVTWTNQDSVPHTATATDDSFDSAILRKGNTYSRTFTAPGTYTYLCTLHPEMTGTVVVATPEDPTPAVVTGSSASHTTHSATTGAAGTSSGSAAAGSTTARSGSGSSAGGVPQSVPGSATVSMANNQFQPADVSVGAGGIVTWTNTDTVPHTVTADDGSFDSDILMPGNSFSYQFDQPGAVAYRCILHPGMAGTVTVLEAAAAVDPAATAQLAASSAGDQPGVGGAGEAGTAPSSDRIVSISGTAFPAVTVLSAGHSVTWVNDDTVDHDVIALDGTFTSEVLRPGEQFTFTFDEPGAFPYTCDLHKHMGGTVIVLRADEADLADGPTVSVTDSGFEPADLTVHQGDTVVWAFGGVLPHTVSADDGSFGSDILEPGATFSHTFDTLGSFRYTCTLHPAMVGTITVVEADVEIAGIAAPGTGATPVAGLTADVTGAVADAGGGGLPTSVLIGFGVGGGLLTATLLAFGVAAVTHRSGRVVRPA